MIKSTNSCRTNTVNFNGQNTHTWTLGSFRALRTLQGTWHHTFRKPFSISSIGYKRRTELKVLQVDLEDLEVQGDQQLRKHPVREKKRGEKGIFKWSSGALRHSEGRHWIKAFIIKWCNDVTTTKKWEKHPDWHPSWLCGRFNDSSQNQGNSSFYSFEQKPQWWDGSRSTDSIPAMFARYQIHFCRVCNANGWEDWKTGLKIGLAYFRCCTWHNGGGKKKTDLQFRAARTSSGCQNSPACTWYVTDSLLPFYSVSRLIQRMKK